MSIKSDLWIRRMAEQHGLIERFGSNQVRRADGRNVISYGTSNYGYDIRCAPEFEVFTNIHSDACIIPPNSFALARTATRSATCPTRTGMASTKARWM